MNRTLIRQHAMMRPVYIKWLLVVVATSTLWLGVMSFDRGRVMLEAPWQSLAWIWVAPALFLAFGPHTERAGEFVLTLPLPTRRIWTAHVLAVLLTSGLMFAVVLAFAHLTLLGLRQLTSTYLEPLPGLARPMLTWWSHGLAWWLLLVALTLNDRPGVARIRRDRAWRIRQLLWLAVATGGMLGLGFLGPVAALAPLVAAGLLVRRAYRTLPAAMVLIAREPEPAAAARKPDTLTATSPGWRRLPDWIVVVRTTSKHPALLLLAAVFTGLVGFALSGWNSHNAGGEHLGVFMIPITAYMMFAMAGTPLLKLSLFDHLPLSRARMLSVLIVPQLLILILGFGVGELTGLRSAPKGDFLTWNNGGEQYGIRIAPKYYAVTWDEMPTNVSPDGTTSTPPADWRPLGPWGPTLYDPYHVFPGADLDFCSWQLERATARIFGQAIPAAEFRERLLFASPDGTVGWRDDAPTIREAHPELAPRRFSGLAPLQLLLVGVLFQSAFAIYLGTFRAGVSDRRRKATFVVILVVLMALYMAPFVIGMARLGDPVGINVLVLATSDFLAAAMPGGLVGLWLLTIVVLAVGYRAVLHRFRRAEWPLVREGDAFCDVLG